MRDYAITTDSSCDFDQALADSLGVTVVPLSVQIGPRRFRNAPGEAMDSHSFYQLLSQGELAQTSAPNVEEFKAVWRPILQSGRDLLYLGFSSGLSGTYHNAAIAAEDLREEFPEARIITVDTLCASLGQGLLAYYAARKRDEGLGLEALKAWLEDNKLHLCHWFTVNDLMYLKRGGRINAATAIMGTMLSIKPVMYTSPEGKLIPMGKARGMKAALTELVNTMDKLAIRPIREPVFICHADCPDSVDYVKGLLYERFGITDVRADYIGPVIGSHTGCGTLGLFFLGTER